MSENPMIDDLKRYLQEGKFEDAGIVLAQLLVEENEEIFECMDSGDIDLLVEGFQGELP